MTVKPQFKKVGNLESWEGNSNSRVGKRGIFLCGFPSEGLGEVACDALSSPILGELNTLHNTCGK